MKPAFTFGPHWRVVPALPPPRSAMPRLDQVLVERGLWESRERATRAIMAGRVTINQQTARKPSDPVQPADEVALTAPEKFVRRGGHKLERALAPFQIDVIGL